MRRVLIPQEITFKMLSPFAPIVELGGETMGTQWSVKYVGKVDKKIKNAIQEELNRVVTEMSHWLPGSHLSQFNNAKSDTWHVLPDGFFKVFLNAIQLSKDSGGAYNPVSGALTNLWGFGAETRYDTNEFIFPEISDVEAIKQKQLHYQNIQLNASTKEVHQPGGMHIDLSSIAKGYAVDCVAECLELQGIEHYLVEIGGELRGSGMKPDGQPWWVTLEQPLLSDKPCTNIQETYLALHNLAVATSGNYRRYFHKDNQVYSHTIDPRTGYPINNNIVSVTVIHENCMMADALSTALTVLGVEDGLTFAEHRGLAARFVFLDETGFNEKITNKFSEMLQ